MAKDGQPKHRQYKTWDQRTYKATADMDCEKMGDGKAQIRTSWKPEAKGGKGMKDDLTASQAYSENVIYPEVRRQNAHAMDCCKRAAHLIRKAITMLRLGDAPDLAEELRPFAARAKELGEL